MATTISTDSPKLTADVASRAEVYGGRGLDFDGVSDYLDCGDIDTSGNFTFSCWFNADSVAGHNVIFSMSDKSTSDGMTCGFFSGKGGKIYATANHGSTSSTKITSVLSTGQWYHLAVTKSSGQTETIYINGISDTNSADTNWGLVDETIIGARNAGSNFLFNGKLSDVKLYNSILTEAEVQSQYLKPESVPSPSTLVAWYPMCESNPESPQSIVYDHSEKKLGDSDWNLHTSSTTGTGNATSDGVITYEADGYQFFSGISNNTLYKVQYTIATRTAGGLRFAGGSSAFGSVTLADSIGTHTYYLMSEDTDIGLRSTGFRGTITDYSAKPILMGNHATTKFYGSELITNSADREFTSDTGFWNLSGSTITGNKLVFSNNSALNRRDGLLTNSKNYQVIVDVSDYTSGSFKVYAHGIQSSAIDSQAVHTVNITAGTSNTSFAFNCTGFTGSINSVSVKEVGVLSSGFTTAQNEPVIPQIPLVRYNEKMVHKGTTGQYVDVDIDSFNLGDFTISFWYNTNNSEGTFIGRSVSSVIRFSSTQSVFRVGSNNYYISGTTGTEIASGRLLTATREGTSFKLYIDGVLDSTTTVVTDAWLFGGNARIGQSAWGNFDGTIHECSVFNTALNSTQIQEIFNDGIALDATNHSKSGNLLGYWRNDGVTTWQDRRGWSYLDFDGTGDYVDTSTGLGTSLGDSYTGDLSFSIWANLTDVSAVNDAFVHIGNFSNNHGLITVISLANNVIFRLNGTTWSVTETLTNGWHHIMAVWDSSDYTKTKLYVDGVTTHADNSSSFPSSLDFDEEKTIIGAFYSSAYTFDGQISSVAIYNDAKSLSEVQSIYNSGINSSEASNSNLIGYWKLNTASTDANAIKDLIGTNHGTVNGNPTLNTGNDGSVQGTPDSITIREGLNSNKDGLGFPFTNPSSNVLRLNGSSEYLNLGSPTSLTDIWQTGATVEMWLKPEGSTGNMGIMHKSGNGNQGWQIKCDSFSGGKWHIRLVGVFSGDNYVWQKNTYLTPDIWSYWAITWTSIAGGSATWYSSNEAGVLSQITSPNVDNTSTGTYTSDDGFDLIIGSKENNSTKWNGMMDEIMIYNRILTSDEISKNFKYSKGKHKND